MADKLLNLLWYRSGTENNNSIADSEDYRHFRSNVALKRVVLDDDSIKAWSIYECGPREVCCPVIFLPPVSGSADIFFRQVRYLSERGHRVISTEYPPYFSLEEFLHGFRRFIHHFGFHKVHVFGASLGGFLAQKFTEHHSELVASLVLCNTFADTARFKFVNTVPLVWLAPPPILRNYFIDRKIPEDADELIRDAGQFMQDKLQNLSHADLLSRLSLNLTDNYVQPDNLQRVPITIVDVFDHCANSELTREELYKMYPHARRAHLKTGGNFPYLSRPDEVNLHLLVHLRQFHSGPDSSNVNFLLENDDDDDNVSQASSSIVVEAEVHCNGEDFSVEVATEETGQNPGPESSKLQQLEDGEEESDKNLEEKESVTIVPDLVH